MNYDDVNRATITYMAFKVNSSAKFGSELNENEDLVSHASMLADGIILQQHATSVVVDIDKFDEYIGEPLLRALYNERFDEKISRERHREESTRLEHERIEAQERMAEQERQFREQQAREAREAQERRDQQFADLQRQTLEMQRQQAEMMSQLTKAQEKPKRKGIFGLFGTRD